MAKKQTELDDVLSVEITELNNAGFDLLLTGFSEDEILEIPEKLICPWLNPAEPFLPRIGHPTTLDSIYTLNQTYKKRTR